MPGVNQQATDGHMISRSKKSVDFMQKYPLRGLATLNLLVAQGGPLWAQCTAGLAHVVARLTRWHSAWSCQESLWAGFESVGLGWGLNKVPGDNEATGTMGGSVLCPFWPRVSPCHVTLPRHQGP